MEQKTLDIATDFRAGEPDAERVRRLGAMVADIKSHLESLLSGIHTGRMPDEDGANYDHDKRYLTKAKAVRLIGSPFGPSKLVAPDGDPDPAVSVANDGDVTFVTLTASLLVATNASKELVSVGNLASWIAGTSNRVTVADDLDGTVTLSGPQDIHTGATPEFVGMKLSGGTIVQTTADASDNGYIALSGGGAVSQLRGARMYLFGNEHATSPGFVEIYGGAGVTGTIVLYPQAGAQTYGFTATQFTSSAPIQGTHIGIGTAPDGVASLKLNDVADLAGNFLTIAAGVVNYRTPAEALADMGGGVVNHSFLSATHSDTLADNVLDGDVVIGNVTPKWSRLAISIPAAAVRNVLGIDNGELRPSWKTALDGTTPATIAVGGAGTPGTSLVFSHRDHNHPAPATWTPSAHLHDGDTLQNDGVNSNGGAFSFVTTASLTHVFGVGYALYLADVTTDDTDKRPALRSVQWDSGTETEGFTMMYAEST